VPFQNRSSYPNPQKGPPASARPAYTTGSRMIVTCGSQHASCTCGTSEYTSSALNPVDLWSDEEVAEQIARTKPRLPGAPKRCANADGKQSALDPTVRVALSVSGRTHAAGPAQGLRGCGPSSREPRARTSGVSALTSMVMPLCVVMRFVLTAVVAAKRRAGEAHAPRVLARPFEDTAHDSSSLIHQINSVHAR
jgi:hypothetical protein